MLGAREKALTRERWLFNELVMRLHPELDLLRTIAECLADLDALNSLAICADELDWCCPELLDTPGMDIDAGRHPVVEALSDQPFVPNPLLLTPRAAHVAGDRTEHGRQVDLHAPECADCTARPTPAASFRRAPRGSAPSIASSRGSVRQMISPAVSRPSWSR